MILNKTEKGDGIESVILTKQDVEATINAIGLCVEWLNMAADFVPHNERVITHIRQLSIFRSRFEMLLEHGDLPDDLNVGKGPDDSEQGAETTTEG